MKKSNSAAADLSPCAAATDVGKPLALIAVVVLGYAALVYLPFLDGDSRLLTRHEVMQAQPALTILETGDWLVPELHGQPWMHKPPLSIWITAILFDVFGGFSETLARLPSALSAILLCLLVTVVAARHYEPRAAMLAGLAQATCAYMFMQGRLGEVDMLFALLIAAAHAILLRQWGGGRYDLRIGAACLFHLAAGLAILTKGPLAVGLIGVPIILFGMAQRTMIPVVRVLFTPAILISIVVGFGWYAAIIVSLGDDAVGSWRSIYVERFLGNYHLKTHGPLFYFYTIPWLVLPWTIALLVGAKRLWRDAQPRSNSFDRYLWCWFLAGLGVLTLAAFRSKHYAIPILPPLSILAGKLADLHIRKVGIHAKRFYVVGFSVAAAIFLFIGGYVMPARDWRRPTVAFLNKHVPEIPRGATFYVAGLGQSSAYPYISVDYDYINSFSEAKAVVDNNTENDPWILTYRMHLIEARKRGFQLVDIAAEAQRERVSYDETLVLARLISAPAADGGDGSTSNRSDRRPARSDRVQPKRS